MFFIHITFKISSYDGLSRKFCIWLETTKKQNKKSRYRLKRDKKNLKYIPERNQLFKLLKELKLQGFEGKTNLRTHEFWLPSNSNSMELCMTPDLMNYLNLKEPDPNPNCWLDWEIPTLEIEMDGLFSLLHILRNKRSNLQNNNYEFGFAVNYLVELYEWTLNRLSDEAINPIITQNILREKTVNAIKFFPNEDANYRALKKRFPLSLYFPLSKFEIENQKLGINTVGTTIFEGIIFYIIFKIINQISYYVKRSNINIINYGRNSKRNNEMLSQYHEWLESIYNLNTFNLHYLSSFHFNRKSIIIDQFGKKLPTEEINLIKRIIENLSIWTENKCKILTYEKYMLGFFIKEPKFHDSLNISQTSKKSETPKINKTSEDLSFDSKWCLEVFICKRSKTGKKITREKYSFSDRKVMDKIGKINYNILLKKLFSACFNEPILASFFLTPLPERIYINADEMVQFLKNKAPILELKGIYVDIPEWWSDISDELRLILKLNDDENNEYDSQLNIIENKQVDSNILPPDSYETDRMYANKNYFGTSFLSFDWKVAIGDSQIEAKEFERLLQQNEKLIRWNGKWLSIPQKYKNKYQKLVERTNQNNKISLGKAIRLILMDKKVDEGFEIIGLESSENLQEKIKNLLGSGELDVIPQPKSFNGVLRPYQQKGLSWLVFLSKFCMGSCLADDMGLGKTIQLIAFLIYQHEMFEGIKNHVIKNPAEIKKINDSKKTGLINLNNSKPISLLICPLSLIGNWCHELDNFGPTLTYSLHYGNKRNNKDIFQRKIKNNDLIITTYDIASRDQIIMQDVNWQNIILDEAQHIKNWNTKRTQAIIKLHSYHKIALTGTPIENKLTELWSIMEFLNPGYLGSKKQFKERFSIPISKNHNCQASDDLKKIIHPFILRRLKTDKKIVKELPEKYIKKYYCNLKPKQASLYQSVVDQMLEKIDHTDGIERKGSILATITKLKQICDHPNLATKIQNQKKVIDISGKLELLIEIVEKIINNDERVIIFTQYVKMGEILQNVLGTYFGKQIYFVHGKTSIKKRQSIIQLFQNAEEDSNSIEKKLNSNNSASILIMSLKTGGLGLNLVGANNVIHYDRWWNPAVEDQATDRTYRIGQTRNVNVYLFICTGTLEEHIDEMLENKKQLADSMLVSGDKWLTEMSTNELKKILKLRSKKISD